MFHNPNLWGKGWLEKLKEEDSYEIIVPNHLIVRYCIHKYMFIKVV